MDTIQSSHESNCRPDLNLTRGVWVCLGSQAIDDLDRPSSDQGRVVRFAWLQVLIRLSRTESLVSIVSWTLSIYTDLLLIEVMD